MTAGLIAAAAAGALTWTFLEYHIHRWLGHHRRLRRNPFGVEHVRHHIEGDYFAPTWKKLLIGPAVGAALCGPVVWLVGVAPGVAYVTGVMVCYGLYEVVHRRIHTHAGIGPYGRWLRLHHFHHHLVDGRTNHGVTSPIWDLVFGTYRPASHIAVPPQLCMVWLLDPETGQVRAEHAASYSLRRRPAHDHAEDGGRAPPGGK